MGSPQGFSSKGFSCVRHVGISWRILKYWAESSPKNFRTVPAELYKSHLGRRHTVETTRSPLRGHSIRHSGPGDVSLDRGWCRSSVPSGAERSPPPGGNFPAPGGPPALPPPAVAVGPEVGLFPPRNRRWMVQVVFPREDTKLNSNDDPFDDGSFFFAEERLVPKPTAILSGANDVEKSFRVSIF